MLMKNLSARLFSVCPEQAKKRAGETFPYLTNGLINGNFFIGPNNNNDPVSGIINGYVRNSNEKVTV